MINILLFILFYCIQMFPIVAYSGAYGTTAEPINLVINIDGQEIE